MLGQQWEREQYMKLVGKSVQKFDEYCVKVHVLSEIFVLNGNMQTKNATAMPCVVAALFFGMTKLVILI